MPHFNTTLCIFNMEEEELRGCHHTPFQHFLRPWYSILVPSLGNLVEISISGPTPQTLRLWIYVLTCISHTRFLWHEVWEALPDRIVSSNPHKPMWPLLPQLTDEATETQKGAITGLGQDHTVADWHAKTVLDLLVPTAELFPPHDVGLVWGWFVCLTRTEDMVSVIYVASSSASSSFFSGFALHRLQVEVKREVVGDTASRKQRWQKVRFSLLKTFTRKLEKGFNLWISGNPGNLHIYRTRIKILKGLGWRLVT